MKLYCFPRSGNSREVKIVLAEKGLPYESVNIHADKQAAESEEFLKASPRKTVPALIDGKVAMSEAFLINQYLDEEYPNPPLMPRDEKDKQRVREWVDSLDQRMVKRIGALVIETLLKPKEQQKEEVKEKLRAEILERIKEVDKKLEGQEYLFGSFTLADVAITPHVAAFGILGIRVPEEYKNFHAWLGRIKSRPSFKQSEG